MIYGLVGVSGPVQFTSETRGDLFAFLTGGLGLFTVIVVGYLFLRPARRQGRLGGRTPAGSGNCWQARASGTRSDTSPCATTRA